MGANHIGQVWIVFTLVEGASRSTGAGMENRALHAVEQRTRSLSNGGSVILVHRIGPTDYPLSSDEAAALLIERIGPACVSRAATDIVNFAWTCCRAPELPSRRWASQQRATDICSGSSTGLSKC
jgi:hypothetical protein